MQTTEIREPCLIHFWRQHLAANPLVMAFHSSSGLALALGGGLLVELASTQLGEQAGFFNGALEATDCNFKRLVFFDANTWHL